MEENENKYCYNKMFWLSPNPFFASLIQKLYAGNSGKLISFLQFSYYSHNLSPFGESLSRTFERIANDDLSHIKTLAEMLVMLGEKPLPKVDGKILSLRNIKAETDKSSMWLNSIEIKERSIIDIKTVISKIDNRYIKNALTRILNEDNYNLELLRVLEINNDEG